MLKNIYFWAVLIWASVITFLCLIQFRSVPLGNVSHIDKLVHAFFYFVFTVLNYYFLKDRCRNCSRKMLLTIAFVSSILFGIGIEVAQELFTTTRHADLLDVAANTSGAMIAIVVLRFILKDKL